MNSKQRRRLRKQKLPELLNLLATKKITGELHPWINTANLAKAAAKNPQRIAAVMPMLRDDDHVGDTDFMPRSVFNRMMRAGTGRTPSAPNFMNLPRDPGKSVVYGKAITQILHDEIAWVQHKDKATDDLLDVIKYGSTQTFCTPEEVPPSCQESPGSL